MNNVYVPSTGASDWQRLLAEPEKHWKPGYSAHALATCWENAIGLPSEVRNLFAPHFSEVELLLAIPEYKVPLPGGTRESQNDLFCLLRADGLPMVLMVEGKVEEPFDKPLGEWLARPSDGRQERLAFITKTIGLQQPIPPAIRYQLLHRTASAVITARRFGANKGAMVVHSFSRFKSWLADFKAFAALWNAQIDHDQMTRLVLPDGFELFLGWSTGELVTGGTQVKETLSGIEQEST